MSDSIIAEPGGPRMTAMRGTIVAALTFSAAAHAGAVYWAISGSAPQDQALRAGGAVEVELVLVQGPAEPPAGGKPGPSGAGVQRMDAEPGRAADSALSRDSADKASSNDRTAPVPAPQKPETAPAAPPDGAPVPVVAPPPPPKPMHVGPPEEVPAQADRAEPAVPRASAPAGAAGGRESSGRSDGAQEAAPLADNPAPDYPYAARLHGREGRVLLRVEVLASGGAGSVVVETSSGYESLDRSALQAVRRWRFRPARRNGEPVAASVQVPVRFSLR